MTSNRSFKKLLYFQVILGMVAYAIAEKSPFIALTIPTLALLSWYVVEAPGGKPLPRWLINGCAIVFCSWLVFALSNERFQAINGIGRFLLFLQVAKLYEAKPNRDIAQIILLSLMQAISAAMISIDFHFGIFMVCYLIVSLVAALQFQFKLARDQVYRANLKAAPVPEAVVPQPVAASRHTRRQFAALTGVCALLAVVFSSIVFVAIPRGIGKGMLGGFQRQSDLSEIGFTDQVDLDDDSLLSYNDQPMLNVQFLRNGQNIGSPARTFLLRGNAMDIYINSNNQWRRNPPVVNRSRLYLRHADKVSQFTKTPMHTNALEQRVTLMGDTKRILFATSHAVAFESETIEGITF
ncbi:MAG: DUF3488 domain-containing protein, partial [Planctomycetota bacterium]